MCADKKDESASTTAVQPPLWTARFSKLCLANFLLFLGIQLQVSPFPFYIVSLGGTEASAGMVVFIYFVFSIVLKPFVGYFLDSWKRRALLMIGMLGAVVVPYGFVIAGSVATAVIVRIIQAFPGAINTTGTQACILDIVPRSRLGEGSGIIGVTTALANALGPAIGLWLMAKGYNVLFAAISGLSLMAFFLVLITPVPDVPPEKRTRTLKLKTLIEPTALPASVIFAVTYITYGATTNFLSYYAAEASLPSGGLFFFIGATITVIMRFTMGKITDRYGEGPLAYMGFGTLFVGMLVLAGTVFVASNHTAAVVLYLLAAVLVGIGNGSLQPALLPMATRLAPMQRRGAATSTFMMSFDLSLGLGGLLAGNLVAVVGFAPMFLFMMLPPLVGFILYQTWGRNHPSSFGYEKRHQQAVELGEQ